MSDPRGIRNNNPGNLRDSGIDWEGAVGSDDGFVQFDGPVAGGKALIKNLMAYHTKYGIDTVEGVINRWAPPSENRTADYVSAVAHRLGVDPKEPLDMRSPQVLGQLAASIARHENGRDFFDPQFFPNVAAAVVQTAPVDQMTKAYADSSKQPTFTKAMTRMDAMSQHSAVPVDTAGQGGTFDEQFPLVGDTAPMYAEDSKRIATQQEGTGFSESVLDAIVHNTVTGKLVEMADRGAVDPTFDPMSEENRQRSINAGIYGNDRLMDFVTGANNADDFSQRLQTAQDRLDFQRRMENTEGLSRAGAVTGQLIGSVADPVALVATMGAGALVASVRGAAATTRAMAVLRGAAAGAAENAALGQVLEQADNERFHWGTLFGQAAAGAALGAVGGLLVGRDGRPHIDPTSEVKPEAMPVMNAAARSAQDVVDAEVARAFDAGQVRAGDIGADSASHALSTQLAELDGHSLPLLGETKVAGVPGVPRTRMATAIDEAFAVRNEEAALRPVSRELAEHPITGEHTTAEIELRRLAEKADDNLVRTLSSRLLEQVQAYEANTRVVRMSAEEMRAATNGQGRAFYDSASGEVGITHGATDAEILHEIAHAATVDKIRVGLANIDSATGKLVQQLEQLRLQMQDLHGTAPDEHTRYFLQSPEEFVAGLYSGHSDFIERLASTKIQGESLLSRTVQIVRSLLGLDSGETNALLKALDLSDQLISRHADLVEASGSKHLLPADREALPLNAREARLLESLEAVGENLDTDAVSARRAQKWLNDRPDFLKKGETWAYSPGVVLSASKSKVARIAGSILFENSLGSGKRTSTVSMNYELLQRGYRDGYLMAVKDDIVSLMSAKERADYSFWSGARKAVDRISTQVAEERLRHRAAVQRGEKYVSTAPEAVQRIAGEMDQQIAKMAGDGRAVGNDYADKVMGGGFVGFMPQVWKWDMFGEALRNAPDRWAALKKNFTQQYIEKNVDPVIAEMREAGAHEKELQAVRDRLLQQVDHQVNTRMAESVRDPNTRTSMDTGKFETMAAEMLTENFSGQKVTGQTVAEFRRLLGEQIADRSRTEFDLLREVDGVRLLDYVEHDVVSTIQHTAHRFAGQSAMAKAGFKDYADFEALLTLATKDGATAEEVSLLQFAGRAFGFQPMVAKDHPVLAALRNFVYASTMGKLGIANLADVAAVVTASGVRGMFKTLGYGFRGQTELYKSLATRAGGLLGQDYRIHHMTADVLPNGRAMTGMGASLLRVSQKSAQLVSYINGSNFLQQMLHKGFLPVLAEDLVNAIRGKEGGMSVARLTDAGIDGEVAARIRAQLDKHEPSRKEGDAFQWDSWDDQNAADKLIEAMHRVTYQTFQRALIGEAAMWRSESALGSVIGQFHNFGLTSMEKQLGRNLAINDINTYTAFAVGLAWSALLFQSRLHVNTMGMSSEDAREYMERNTSGAKLAIGTLTYFNMSGIAAELAGVGEVVFGGNSYQAGSGPVAAVGYLGNLSKAANSAGSLVTGQTDNASREARNILRILPGGNSIAGTYYSNYLKDGD